MNVSPTKEDLIKLEKEISADLYSNAKNDHSLHEPITDGVIDIDLYLSTSPKMLWILKEPWEELLEGEIGGGWSVTKDLAAKGVASNRGSQAIMAYVTYAVLNNFPSYGKMDWATDNPLIGESLKSIAYINIKKYPGPKTSNWSDIASHYQKNRSLLTRQISVIKPDIIIGGGTLPLFFEDFGIDINMFNKDRSKAWFCKHEERLFIHANHPAQRGSSGTYIDGIVQIIQANYP